VGQKTPARFTSNLFAAAFLTKKSLLSFKAFKWILFSRELNVAIVDVDGPSSRRKSIV
jgi:hypothetical protein